MHHESSTSSFTCADDNSLHNNGGTGIASWEFPWLHEKRSHMTNQVRIKVVEHCWKGGGLYMDLLIKNDSQSFIR